MSSSDSCATPAGSPRDPLRVSAATRETDERDAVTMQAVAFDECTAADVSSFGHLVPDASTAAPVRTTERRVERPGEEPRTISERRWLTIFRLEEVGGGGAPVSTLDLGRMDDAAIGFFREDGREGRVTVTEYAVDCDGGYRRVHGTGNDRAPGGSARQAVHLFTRTPYDHRPLHFIRLTRHPLPAVRIEHLVRTLRRVGTLKHTLPVDLVRFATQPPWVVANDKGGPALVRIRLVEPVTWVRARLQAARDAVEAHRTWQTKLRGAGALAALLGAPCYDGRHGRTYLRDRLERSSYRDGGRSLPAAVRQGEAPRVVSSAYAMDDDDTWGDFSLREATGDPEAPTEPDGRALLAHFRYGLRCKHAALTQKQREGLGRVEEALRSASFRAVLRDAAGFDAAAAAALGVSGLEQEVACDLARPVYRLTAIGGGAALTTHILQKSGIMREIEALVRSPEDFERLLDPLVSIEETPARDFLDENSRFRLLLKVASQSAAGLYALVAGMAPAVTAWPFRTSLEQDAPPRGTAFLAALLLRGGRRWKRSTYRIRSSRHTVEFRSSGGTVVLSTVRLTEVDHYIPVRDVVWRLNVQGEVRVDIGAAARSLGLSEEGMGRVASYLDIVNVAVATTALFRNEKVEQGSVADLLTLAQIIVGSAEAVQHGVRSHAAARKAATIGAFATLARPRAGAAVDGALAVGERLVRLGWHIEVAAAALDVYSNAMDRDAVGQMTVQDPNPAGVLGAVAKGVGGVLMTAGVASLGAAALAVGVACFAAGATVQLWAEGRDRLGATSADPLWDWLPRHSLWGTDRRARRRDRDRRRGLLFDLVRPGPVDDLQGVPDDLARRMGEEAQSFLETAYWFPVQVHVGHRPGRSTRDIVPNRLRLDIAYGFLPSVGTLTVNARVMSIADDLDSAPLRCVIHYTELEDHLYYQVCPDGGKLDLPRTVPFTEWVKDKGWPVGRRRRVRLPDGRGGEAQHLSVYLGDWWRRDRSPKKTLSIARPDNTRVSRRRVQDPVHPLAFLDNSDVLQKVLKSGAFQISGIVYFYPLRPFNPRATVPDTAPPFAADQNFRFMYPHSE